MKKRKTIIQPNVFNEAENIYFFIKENSPQNAQNFKKELTTKIDEVELNPEIYPKEPYLSTKNGTYRFALVMQSWKLLFKVTQSLLLFLGIVHTSRHPREIKKLRK